MMMMMIMIIMVMIISDEWKQEYARMNFNH